jgi:hypothetical protein
MGTARASIENRVGCLSNFFIKGHLLQDLPFP